MSKTIFQMIIEREIDAKVLFEDDDIICIEDKYPQAPVHVLLISKKLIESVYSMKDSDYFLLKKIFSKAKELSQELGISENYRILTNHGPDAGQTIFQMHFHLLGGGKLCGKGK